MCASGFAALGYQIVWTQQCAVWLGHETAAVLAVVAAFFGGLALGAALLGPRIVRSKRAARWYAACEGVVAAWSLMLAVLMTPVGSVLLDFIGAQPSPLWHWCSAFVGTFILLLPATAAMGATLPAMEQVLSQWQTSAAGSSRMSIASLYASNTFGAVIGVLATAFWLIPVLGLVQTTLLCALINVLCAIAALRLRTDHTPTGIAERTGNCRILWTLVSTGFLGIGYEVLVVRVLSQVAEDTVYTFAMLLAVYLCFTALGAAAHERWREHTADPNKTRQRLFGMQAAACLLSTCALWGAQNFKSFAMEALGPGMGSAIAAEGLLALIAFAAPTFVMGALFSHLATQARADGISFGRALAFNTVGAAIAPLVFGVLLVPALGPKLALLIVTGGYLALASLNAWRSPWVWLPATAALALAVWAPPLQFVDMPEGGQIVSYRDGAMASVSVVADAQGVMRLRIDNRQQEGSSDSRLADARQALLPLLLHPSPKRALFLGMGTGVTSYSAAEDPTLQVDVVELLPEVISASDHFTRLLNESAEPSRLHAIAADARRYVRASTAQYDLIVSDNFHPARSGSGALYTVEHFKAVRQRLADGGLFCQWLPLHQLDLETTRSIVKAFVTAYPDAQAILATNSLETPVVGLIGHAGTAHIDVGQLRQRLATAAWPHHPAEFGLHDEFAVLGSFIAGPQSLAHFAQGAAANTDDRPVVAYMAPRITYAPDSLPRDRLLALLSELSVSPTEVLVVASNDNTSKRIAAYWAARNRYIEIGRDITPTNDVERMLAQVRDPLLAVLRSSPDFRPAYDPLLMMAGALVAKDAVAARSLFEQLRQAQPARLEAVEALRRLDTTLR